MQLDVPHRETASGIERANFCQHCNTRLPGDCDTAPFCCTGCRLVFGLLSAQHLERFYDLRGTEGVAVPGARDERRDLKWLEALEATRREQDDIARVDLDVQGLHCSACVWLIETVFRRNPGAAGIIVNPAVGRAQLLIGPSFPLEAFVREVERFGYLFGPALKRSGARAPGDGLLVRMGISIALAMNTMLFAIAHYAGLTEGPSYVLFQRWTIALSVASVIIGGSVFFRSAWQGIRQRVLHLDLPIAVGIVLAFVGSMYAYSIGRSGGVFVDTLNVFIALMLVGRYLQERVLERNRLALLESDGVEGLLARRQVEGVVTTVRCVELRRGDHILLAPGDLVPLDATLSGPTSASFSFDWINGESRSRTFAEDERVPAGAFLTGSCAVTLVASQDFDESPLPELLRTPLARSADAAMSMSWWRRLAKVYVVAVLAAAAVGFVAWFFTTHDLARSLEVTTAVLIVTCPCAFGIATPLAYDLAQAGLRRAGLYVRSAGFLDRAAQVRTVVFDKTGTLTTGALRVVDPRPLEAMLPGDRRALASMVVTSHHPKSAAVHRALCDIGVSCSPARGVAELPGLGLSLVVDRREYRLGARSWVRGRADDGPEATLLHDADVAFGCDGRILAEVTTEESLRPDARAEVGALRGAGYDVWLLSGDDSARVAQTARVAGVPADRAVGGTSAEGKARWAAAHDHGDLLMIGDGINDSLVVAQAFCSGTPAIDRPFMAARSDFYFVTPGLRPIGLALRVASRVAAVRRRNLALAVAYNVLAVSLAYAGFMSPLVCAVLMPASSLTTILATTFSLSSRSDLWKS